MDRLLIHPSLARGAARTALREAHRSFMERLERTEDFEHVRDESTAGRMADALQQFSDDRLLVLRTEFAKKHSSVLYFGVDVRPRGGQRELGAFLVVSGRGKTECFWVKYKVSLHALERLQQRTLGAVTDISAFADEFGPSFMVSFHEAVSDPDGGFANEERLLPTTTGALLSSFDHEWRGRVGVTWIKLSQLRREQMQERTERPQQVQALLEGLPDGKSRQGFAGRHDRIESRIRESLAAVATNVQS